MGKKDGNLVIPFAYVPLILVFLILLFSLQLCLASSIAEMLEEKKNRPEPFGVK